MSMFWIFVISQILSDYVGCNTARLTKKMSVETVGEPASLGSREKGRRCIQVSPPLPAPLLPTQTKENFKNP